MPRAATAEGVSGARVLVLPFEVAGRHPQSYWLREAVSIVLTDDLARLGADSVSRAERVRAFTRLQLPMASSISRAMAIKVGQLVGATRLILGTLEINEQSIRIVSRTIRLDSGRSGSEEATEGAFDELFGMFGRIARRIAREAGVVQTGALSVHRPPLAAFENFVKGLVAETAPAQTRFLERAVSLHPTYDHARLALWKAYTEQGAHEHALTVIEQVDDGPPLDRRARFAAAFSAIALRRYDEAFAKLNALVAGGYSAAIHSNLGVIQLRRPTQQQLGTAVYFFNKAVQSDPDGPDYLFNLGYAYYLAQDIEAAIYWLREVVRRNPADRAAHLVLASALDRVDATVEAARERQLAERLSPGASPVPDPPPVTDAGQVPGGLERLKIELEPSRAERLDRIIVSAAEREQHELATFHRDRGRKLFAAERDRDALADLRRTVYLDPYQAEAHLLIGRLHLRAGRTPEAIKALIISLWNEPSVEGHVALAEAYLQNGEPGKARAEAAQALARDRTSTAARALLDRLSGSRAR